MFLPLYQKAVLWPALDGFDNLGNRLIGEAQEIAVRWETGRRDTLDPKGNVIAVDATAFVDRKITIGSRLWLGKLSEIGTGLPTADMMEVVDYRETPDIKGRRPCRVVTLNRLY